MRVLLLSHSPNNPNGGASRVFHLLSESLEREGHETTLLHLEDTAISRDSRVRLLQQRTAMPALMSDAAKKHSPEDFDAIIAASGMGYPLFRSLRSRPTRPFLVNMIHGLTVYDDLAARAESHLGHWPTSVLYRSVTGPFQVRWDARGIRAADATVVQNLRDVSEARELAGDDDLVHFIPPALHPELLSHSEQIRSFDERDTASILWFGTWEARKGTHLLPKALREIRASRPDATLTIGGSGRKQDELLREFDPLDRDAVRVLPRVSIEEQVELFNSSSIFLFPSLSEGFGLALLEAMSFGLAAVTSPTGFAADSMTDGVHGRVTTASAAHISRAVLELIGDDDLRRRVSESGRELARIFTPERMGAGYSALLNDGVAAQRLR